MTVIIDDTIYDLNIFRNGSGGGVTRVWKPEISKDLDNNFRVNLEHNGSVSGLVIALLNGSSTGYMFS